MQRRGDPNVVIALAGNKADMENKRKVQTEEAQQYARDSDIIHMETSAKTSSNVRNLFIEIGTFIFVNVVHDCFSIVLLSSFLTPFIYYHVVPPTFQPKNYPKTQ